MRLGYTDKYGVKQVAEVVSSRRIDNCSFFKLASGTTVAPVSFSPWEVESKDIETLMEDKAVEQYIMFEGISDFRHTCIVSKLTVEGYCFIDDNVKGEYVVM